MLSHQGSKHMFIKHEGGQVMEQLGQSIQLTLIGLSVVFIVLTLLTILLKLQGKFMAPETETDIKDQAREDVESKAEESTYISKTSSSNPKMAAAITAALAMYEKESEKDNKERN